MAKLGIRLKTLEKEAEEALKKDTTKENEENSSAHAFSLSFALFGMALSMIF